MTKMCHFMCFPSKATTRIWLIFSTLFQKSIVFHYMAFFSKLLIAQNVVVFQNWKISFQLFKHLKKGCIYQGEFIWSRESNELVKGGGGGGGFGERARGKQIGLGVSFKIFQRDINCYLIITYHIWVSFCRTGKIAVLCPFFLKSRASVWPNLIR